MGTFGGQGVAPLAIKLSRGCSHCRPPPRWDHLERSRGFELEPPERRSECVGARQQQLAFGDQRAIPQRSVLMIEGARRAGSCQCSCLCEREERGEAPGLGLRAEQAGGEPPRLVGHRFVYALVLVEPVDGVGAVDGLEYSRRPWNGDRVPSFGRVMTSSAAQMDHLSPWSGLMDGTRSSETTLARPSGP